MLQVTNEEYFNHVISTVQENNLFNVLNEKLDYLGNYGQHNELYEYNVLIGYDTAKWSFGLCWMRRKRCSSDEFEPRMYGGLIYFESTKSWSVHT